MKKLMMSGLPLLFVGAPGTGKTAIIQQSFDHAEIILTSTMVEEDMAGLPYRDGAYDFRTIPALFRRLHEADSSGKTTVLFLDELDKARRSVADTLLTLIASRKVGESSLPERTAIIAAANPPHFGGGDGISDAMISRFTVLDFVPSAQKWCAWARERFKSNAAEKIIRAVECGELSLIDCAGDGLERRITSPRTLSMALSYIERMGVDDHCAAVFSGLLTAATSSQAFSIVKNIENKVMAKASAVRLRAAKGGNKIEPLVF